jgi:flagellar biosynthesis protein FlhB
VSEADRRYPATPARRRRARREGNVARSAELASLTAFAGALLAASPAVPFAARAAARAIADAATAGAGARVGPALVLIAGGALLPAFAAACCATGATLAQSGGLHLMPVTLEAKRLDPLAGLRRMFGGEAAVALTRAAVAFAAATVALVPLGAEVVAAGTRLGSPVPAAALVASAALRACTTALAVGALFAVADYALARRRWLRGLRMSLDELKRDAKENDGDPQARARRAGTHREIVRGAIGRTREASFVVVNPTHVAVALRYAPPGVPVPEILVRARDAAALQVRAIARAHGIPLVEDVALARLLYAHGRSGRAIPAQTYVAVAQVLAELARAGVPA